MGRGNAVNTNEERIFEGLGAVMKTRRCRPATEAEDRLVVSPDDVECWII
jgi:hypothetical protein